MALDIPTGFGQHTIRWSLNGSTKQVSSSYGVSFDEEPNFNDTLDALNTAWSDHMAGGALGADWTMQSGQLEDNDTVAELQINEGGSSFDSPPPNVCVLLKKTSSQRGRSNHGRMYLPAGYIAEANVDNNGIIGPSALTDIQDNVSATFGAVLTVEHVNGLVIFHTVGSSSSDPTPIDQILAEPMVATQRRRLR